MTTIAIQIANEKIIKLEATIAALKAKLAEQSAIISGKTFHDVQEATARECAKIAEEMTILMGRNPNLWECEISAAIREKYNIKD